MKIQLLEVKHNSIRKYCTSGIYGNDYVDLKPKLYCTLKFIVC